MAKQLKQHFPANPTKLSRVYLTTSVLVPVMDKMKAKYAADGATPASQARVILERHFLTPAK